MSNENGTVGCEAKDLQIQLSLDPKGPSRQPDKRVEENRRALDEMTGNIEHSKNIYGAEYKIARAECKKRGGARAWAKKFVKWTLLGLK